MISLGCSCCRCRRPPYPFGQTLACIWPPSYLARSLAICLRQATLTQISPMDVFIINWLHLSAILCSSSQMLPLLQLLMSTWSQAANGSYEHPPLAPYRLNSHHLSASLSLAASISPPSASSVAPLSQLITLLPNYQINEKAQLIRLVVKEAARTF